ncbi:MAG: mannose-6-phosphate isomerase, class I [Bacteroidetes bacterium]|nr:mannose-6-phosphate isomerase, class I [Bacteroidota bacterium]
METNINKKIFKLKGKVQHYAWGGKTYIPNLIHFNNTENKPCAEYWMGAHPSASSTLVIDGNDVLLTEIIAANPSLVLTESIVNKFGELPYLYKILDVNEMLSIQVHPSKEEAAKGFEREEAAGIAINAFNRNYKDKNHKPEVMIALGEFWLLHGFMQLDAIEKRLQEIIEFNVFLPLFRKEGLKSLYKMIMELSQEEVDAVLASLIKTEMRRREVGELNKSMPGWWATKLFKPNDEIKNIDRGVFSIYLFNIVGLQKGEGIFQAAGVPHAYLEGQNVELMANSDNVLRGGLTPKHIDVPELMKHTLFEPVIPNVLKGDLAESGERKYHCPVPDFSISKVELLENQTYNNHSLTPEILLIVSGECAITSNDTSMSAKSGETFFIYPNEKYKITTTSNCDLYKAYVD